MSQQTLGWKPLQIIHHYFPRDEKKMEAFIDANPGDGFVVNVKEPWNDPNDHAGYDTYLRQPEEWKTLDAFIRLCSRKGKRIWIYDEPGFPSGAAGRRVVETNPSYAVSCLACKSAETTGGTGEMLLPEGDTLLAAAIPMAQDGTLTESEMRLLSPQNGRLCWTLPEGNYRIAAIIHKPCQWITGAGVPYIDVLNPQAVRTFIQCTHESYRQNLSAEAFRHIEAFFSDEPGLPVYGCSMIFNEPDPVVPWTEGLEADFLNGCGYPLRPRLASLFFDTDSGGQVRRDFWRLVSARLEESYFGQIADWCTRYDICLTGHLYGEETLSMQIGLNGDLFGLQRRMTLPGVDRLYCTNPTGILPEKTAASAADLMGYRRVMSESSACFESSYWHTSHDTSDILHACLYQMILGINVIASYFSPGEYPSAKFCEAYETIGRVGSIMDGYHQAPVLFLLPMEGAWERYRPVNQKYWSMEPESYSPKQPYAMQRLEQYMDAVMTRLLDSRLDFDLIDDRGLQTCRVINGRIQASYEDFDLLVLFDTGDFLPETLAALQRLAQAGGRMLCIREGETLSQEIRLLAEQYADRVCVAAPEDAVKAASALCRPVLKIKEEAPFLWVRRCRRESEDVCLLHCRDGQQHTVTVLPEPGQTVFVYDPASGNEEPARIQDTGFSLEIPAKQCRILRLTAKE